MSDFLKGLPTIPGILEENWEVLAWLKLFFNSRELEKIFFAQQSLLM